MRTVSKQEVLGRIRFENPWWAPPHQVDEIYLNMKPRAYQALFFPLVKQKSPARALLLMGPRRVGKTVILYQSIQKLIKEGFDAKSLCYINVENPIYNGLGLEQLLRYAWEASASEG